VLERILGDHRAGEAQGGRRAGIGAMRPFLMVDV
jgi:hypothetical protein